MAKNIRITKANQIAVNHIVAAKQEMDRCKLFKESSEKRNDTKGIKIYSKVYEEQLIIWDAQTNMLAAMNGLDWMELIQSDNYRKMREIAENDDKLYA